MNKALIELLNRAENALCEHQVSNTGDYSSTTKEYRDSVRAEIVAFLLATPPLFLMLGEEVDDWLAETHDGGSTMVISLVQHNRIVSALQADHIEGVRAMVVPDIARFEKHAMKAKDCLSECDVVLLSSIRRLLAAAPPTMYDSNGLGPVGPAPGDSQ